MLHIILLIFKIIGIVLLCIIGILLLAVACVLFIPLRYRVRLTREEGEDKPPVVLYIKATWFLHLINVLVRYPAEVVVRVRIFVFTLFRIPGKEKRAGGQSVKEKAQKKPEGRKEKTEKRSAEGKKEVQRQSEEGKQKAEKRSVEEDALSGESGEDSIQHTANQEEIGEKESLPAKIRQIFSKIGQIIEKIKESFKNIQYTIRKFCDKIKAASDNIQYYREVIESVPFRQSVELCKEELIWVLKKLKPDKFEADFIVGMEDPATTGEILAVCGMLYPLIGQHIRVVGDFDCEKTHIEGHLYIRGRIRVITFIRAAVRIYFNKDIKKLIKMFKEGA